LSSSSDWRKGTRKVLCLSLLATTEEAGQLHLYF
jgi:hypothetical protein